MRTAVFGGSFDPPHVAHVQAIEYAARLPEIDRVLVVPVYRHAFNKELTRFEDRIAMLERAVAHVPNAEVSDVESDLPQPNYTVTTLHRLREMFPEDSFRLLVGADVVNDAERWRAFEEVTRLAPLLTLGRAGVHCAAAPAATLPDVSSSQLRQWLSEGSHPEETLEALPPGVAAFICARGLYGVGPSSDLALRLAARSSAR